MYPESVFWSNLWLLEDCFLMISWTSWALICSSCGLVAVQWSQAQGRLWEALHRPIAWKSWKGTLRSAHPTPCCTDKDIAWYWSEDPGARGPRSGSGSAGAGYITTQCFSLLLGLLWGFSKLIFGKCLEQWHVVNTMSTCLLSNSKILLRLRELKWFAWGHATHQILAGVEPVL